MDDKIPNKQSDYNIKDNPIVAEVRAARDRIAEKFNYDVDAMCDHYIAKQKEKEKAGFKYVILPPKKTSALTGT